MHLTIGRWNDSNKPVNVTLETLLTSRALITANSGGGKSYCLRGIIEAMAGHVQQILVDTDGEFASLREKFDFVICAPKGGDAVAHPKTAALLCRRLMETKVSAVLDISELQVADRHRFVRVFLETLMGLGKDLWSPMVLHLDEAHIYCPEKGQGESEASEAVIDLACRGRKRGFCLVAATQRLSKLRKDAAAELLNRLIGRTGLDLDVKRAAFELGMTPTSAQALLPHLKPGQFYAYGPAIAQVMRGMSAIEVKTTHPKPGVARVKDLPRPTPAVKAVLPQLADLQAEAEEETKTLQQLRAELVRKNQDMSLLTRRLDMAEKGSNRPDPETVSQLRKQVLSQNAAIRVLMKFVVKIQTAGYSEADKEALMKAFSDAYLDIQQRVEAMAATKLKKVDAMRAEAAALIQQAQGLLDEKIELDVTVSPQPAHRVTVRQLDGVLSAAPKEEGRNSWVDPSSPHNFNPNYILTAPQKIILDSIAWLNHKGIDTPTREMVSAICKRRGGAYNNNISTLHTNGFLFYPVNGKLALTPHGYAAAQPPRDDNRSLADHWMDVLSNPQKDILNALLELDRPVAREELSEAVRRSGGAFNNNISSMATMGAVFYPMKGFVSVTRNVVP